MNQNIIHLHPKVVCAWCEAESGEKHSRDENVSHGICDRHRDAVLSEFRNRKKAM